jgi:hypothetical protein
MLRDLDETTFAGDSQIEGIGPRGHKKRPFVIVTATSDPERNNAKLFKASGDLHLVKPFNPGFLLRLVNRFQTLLRE